MTPKHLASCLALSAAIARPLSCPAVVRRHWTEARGRRQSRACVHMRPVGRHRPSPVLLRCTRRHWTSRVAVTELPKDICKYLSDPFTSIFPTTSVPRTIHGANCELRLFECDSP